MNKLESCMKITLDCLDKVEVLDKQGEILLKWAKDYYNDGVFYKQKDDLETALEAVSYAHGFIDAGVLLGYLRIEGYHLKKSAGSDFNERKI